MNASSMQRTSCASPSWVLLAGMLTSTLFPLFPGVFGNSPIHLVLVNVVLATVLIIWFGSVSRAVPLVRATWWFFSLQFLLLVVALMIDAVKVDVGLVDLAGIVKPLYLFLFAISGACLAMPFVKVNATANAYFTLVVLFGLVLGAIELLSGSGDSWIYDIYKREERYILRGKTTTWFGVTYYHAYFYLVATVFFYQKLRTIGFRVWDAFLLFCSGTLVITAQSRTVLATMVLLLLTSLFGVLLSRSKRAFFGLIGVILASYIFAVSFLPFLEAHFWYLKVAIELFRDQSLSEVMSQGSIGERLKQIVDATSQSYFVVGAGLGRQGVPLESIYASYFYRFGMLSGLFFILCYSSLGAYLWISAGSSDYLARTLGVIWFASPIALFASPMHEFPKIAFVLFLFSGYSLSRSIGAKVSRKLPNV